MPLTPNDQQFLNAYITHKIAHNRSWRWVRYVLLAFGTFLIVIGIFMFFAARRAINLAGDFDDLLKPIATRPLDPVTATRPVTQEQIQTLDQSLRREINITATAKAQTAIIPVVFYSLSAIQFFMGLNFLFYTLARWNTPRRDTLLLTLLKDHLATL